MPADFTPAAARRHRIWPVAFTLIVYLACVGIRLATHDLDISRFIGAGDHFVTPSRLVYPIAVEANSDGYDGQFFYRMALNPATTKRVDYGISMQSHPVVRVQRILYPAAAWAVSLGHAAAIPYALVVLNLLSLAGIAWIAGLLAEQLGVPARLGLLIPFFPGFILSISRDLAEIPATALAMGSLLAASRHRWPLAAVLASAAVLTRESTLLYLVGYGFVAVVQSVRRRSLDRRIIWCLLPLAVYIVWQVTLKLVWGQFGFEVVGSDDLSNFPLFDYAHALVGDGLALFSLPIRFRTFYDLLTSLSVMAFALFVGRETVKRQDHSKSPIELIIPWCLYTAMAAIFSQAIWRDPWGYVRILCEFYVLGTLILMALNRKTALRALVPFVAFTWVASCAFAL